MRCGAVVLAMLVVAARPVAAEDAAVVATVQPARRVSPARRALAVTAAILPGVLVRGAGSWVAGEKRAAKRLALGAAGSLAVAGIGAAFVGGSHGSPYTVPAIPIAIAGVGGILTSWLEDIWIAAGGPRVEAGPRAEDAWSIEAGELWQHDAYRERLLQRAAATVVLGRVGLGGTALVASGGDAWLAFGDARVRMLGDHASGDWLVARVGGRIQRDDDDHVTQAVGEVEVGGRLGLARFDHAFHNNFVELSTGAGLLRATYNSMVSDVDSVLLGRFAWGAYVPGGEVTVYYDHRRDGLAGGLQAWRAAGFVGSFGAAVDVRVSGPWAVRGEFEIGNAYLTTLAFAYRGGGS